MLARLTATALRPVQSIVGPGFLLAIGLLAFSASSRAGLFSDDEARQAILDLRTRVDTIDDAQKNKLTQLNDKLDQLRNSVLELNNQLEQLRADLAKQRGQNELLARDVAELQRKQKDLQQGVDERVSKLEPQSLTLDGKTFVVDPEEKRSYDEAIGRLRQADFEGAANGLSALLKRYPNTGLRESTLFWLGNAQYGKRDYKESIASFRALLASAPEHIRAPEALLAIANCEIELKDAKAARRTLDELIKRYPKSEAAAAARERLAPAGKR